jgi:hypothetical protein
MGGQGGAPVDCAGGGGLVGPCAPKDPACTAVPSKCIALNDTCSMSSHTLRISQLSITAPKVFAPGSIVGNLVANAVQLNLEQCNLAGGGTFSWLLTIDEATKLLITGGAKPESDPIQGYCYTNEMVQVGKQSVQVSPAKVGASINSKGDLDVGEIDSLPMPIYLDAGASALVLLPLRKVKFTSVQISPERRCIGEYNADELDPANSCLAEPPSVKQFDEAGSIDAFMTLEDADQIIIESLNQSLCVLLSGNAATFGDGGSPSKCKRDAAGVILYKGDWCEATDAAATAACADSVRLSGTLAASAVKLKSGCVF